MKQQNLIKTAIVLLLTLTATACAGSNAQSSIVETAASQASEISLQPESIASGKEKSSKEETSKKESSKEESSKKESSKEESSKKESSKEESSKKESSREEPSKEESSKEESSKEESSKEESSKEESSKEESSKEESSKEESSKQESSREEPSKQESVKEESWIKLQDSNIIIPLGSKYKLNYSTNATCVFTWYWSDGEVLDLSSDGVVTPKAVGTATITAKTDSGQVAECEVTVTEPPPPPPKPVYKDQPVLTGEQVSPSWFDDAVFVGDSVTNKLYYYAENGCLGNAEFLCSVGIGYHSAMWGLDYRYNVHPVYNGGKVLMEDGIRLIGRKKVIIMLGMNDIGGYGVDDTIRAMEQFTDRILQKNPDVQIYIQSVTPLISSIHRKDLLNNTNVALFNQKAQQVCKERGFVFIDIASAVSDGAGNLRDDLCGDSSYMGLHFNNTGCKLWVEYLRAHVQ